MMHSSSFYEIELKSLLTKEQYEKLCNELPQKMKLVNEETLHTTRYRPGDIRLRHSNKTSEIVCKEGDPTKICRKEVKISLPSKKQLDYFEQVFDLLNLQPDPFWIKHKREFEYQFNGHTYIISLQDIKNFAYILEVEFLSQQDDSQIHEPNLKAIVTELGCEPISPKEFLERVSQYIQKNK